MLGALVALRCSAPWGTSRRAHAFAAAGFLYIAVAGLIPGLSGAGDPRTSTIQVFLIGLGVATIAAAEALSRQ